MQNVYVISITKVPITYKGFRWQMKGIKPYARSADPCMSHWWTLPHALYVLFHLCCASTYWALCHASPQALRSRD